MISAHIGGVPIEEVLLPAVGSGAAGLLLTRNWILVRLGRRRGAGR